MDDNNNSNPAVIEHLDETASLYGTTIVGNTVCLLIKLKVYI